MPNLTLASAPVSNADQLVIALVMPPDAPPSFCFAGRAGGAPSVSDPRRFPAAAVAVIAVMDEAVIALRAAEFVTSTLRAPGPNGPLGSP